MTYAHLIRAELRKLVTTKMPWAFLGVLAAIAAVNAALVLWGTDFDGSKAFIATETDQRSLISFASNATSIAGFFGAIAVAREYDHHTVIPTFLAEPRRHRAVLAQLCAVSAGGAAVGLVGAGLTAVAVALSLPTAGFGFLVSSSGMVRILAAAAFAGAVGAVLGAGLGGIVRNTGGAVTATVLALLVAPPLIVQLASSANSWVPATLALVVSGVAVDVDTSTAAAAAALAAWALVPAAIGLIVVNRRDIA